MTVALAPQEGGGRCWLDHYPPATPHSIDDRANRTLVDLFDAKTRQFAKRDAIESFGKRLSYGELGELANAIAAYLQARGLQKGDRVAIMMPNVAAYLPLIFGILKAGGVVVNTNPLYTPRELTHQMLDSGAQKIFYLCLFEQTVAAARAAGVPFDLMVRVDVGDLLGLKGRLISAIARRKSKAKIHLPSAVPFKDVIAKGRQSSLRPVQLSPTDLAFLQYTGGTTGVSKGAMLRHSNVMANVEQCTAWFGPMLNYEKVTHLAVAALPLYHIFGLTACALFMVNIGGCSLLIANPRDIPGFVKILKSRPFTIMAGVNTLYAALADNADFAKVNFSKLQLCVSGGMATKSVVAEKWVRITGKPIIEGYGLSETSPGVTFNRADFTHFTGTIGFPWPSTDVSLRDAEGREVPFGEIGEICVKGPQVMLGYWNRPQETKAVFTDDGYFRTGDMGQMLPDGQVKLVDRLKEMIVVSGFNVYPNEVEDVIAHMPEVREVAVVGFDDVHSGECVTAFVVPRSPDVRPEQVREYCKTMLTGYKVPKHVVFREDLPKSNVGKVLRRVLKEEHSKS